MNRARLLFAASASLATAIGACSFVHDYDALGDGAREAGADANGTDDAAAQDADGPGDAAAEASDASVDVSIRCGAGACTGGSVCCADPSDDAVRTCTAADACTLTAVVCDDTGDCASGEYCCMWKESDTVKTGCLAPDECSARNASLVVCDPDAGCPDASDRCIATQVVPGYFKCEP